MSPGLFRIALVALEHSWKKTCREPKVSVQVPFSVTECKREGKENMWLSAEDISWYLMMGILSDVQYIQCLKWHNLSKRKKCCMKPRLVFFSLLSFCVNWMLTCSFCACMTYFCMSQNVKPGCAVSELPCISKPQYRAIVKCFLSLSHIYSAHII